MINKTEKNPCLLSDADLRAVCGGLTALQDARINLQALENAATSRGDEGWAAFYEGGWKGSSTHL
jgi:hypothetical protein